MDISAVEKLLESFATYALGLHLAGRIRNADHDCSSQVAEATKRECDVTACISWNSDQGIATFRGIYDPSNSARIKGHVLRIQWKIGRNRHDSVWHCYPKFPRDWIKGFGRD